MKNREKEVREILLEAINIERWAEKSNLTYPILEQEEREEMVKQIIKSLTSKGYEIKPKQR
jgi:N-acetyl-anhydromuramyl-L-alanine amidase AmpD